MVEFYVEPNTTTIPLGRQGENLARTIYFELSELISNYGEGTATLVCLRPSDTVPYVCSVTRDGVMLSWSPTDTDTAFAGAGKCELRWVVGDVLAKSIVYTTKISASITGAEEMPDKYQSWYEQLLAQIQAYIIATQRIDVLNARVDSFVALEDGSTTGDAELIDGRTGYDGTTYTNIGTAIRSQISDLHEVVDGIGSQTGDSVPSSVRAALYTLLNNAGYNAETGFSDEIAVIRAWAETVTEIVIDQTAITINGETPVQLTATTTPAGGAVAWSSSDATIATVNSTGLVTGVSNGTAVISAEAGGLTARCTATVTGFVSLTGITATYTQSRTVYDTASLSDLTADLVVTATYDDSSTVTIPSSDYVLSGTLEAGTSTVTVSYGGKIATFNVTVTEYSTAPVIATENVVWSKYAPDTKAANGFGITQWYPYSFSQETLESSKHWDATNGYMSSVGWSGFKVCVPDWNTYNAGYSWPASANFKHVTGKDNVYVQYYSIARNELGSCNFLRYSTTAIEDNCASFSIPLLDKDYSYAYWKPTDGNTIYPDGVSSGDIIFAGRYTPYYGLNNIMEAPDLSSISAVFTQGETVVTESTTLASLKTMLDVTALYDNSKTLPVNLGLVTLSGTLTEGTSVITATYEDKTATFNVTVTAG